MYNRRHSGCGHITFFQEITGMKNLSFDISKEMFIEPFLNGVRLIKPKNDADASSHYNINSCVKNVYDIPINVFFLDTDCRIQSLNTTAQDVCAYPTEEKTRGNTLHIAARKKEADIIIGQDREIFSKKCIMVEEYHFMRLDGNDFSALAIRYPLYNEMQSIIGLFSFSIILGDNAPCSLITAMSRLMQTGLLIQPKEVFKIPYIANNQINGIQLTKREMDCVRLASKGYTAKKSALKLNLSVRTVEYYLSRAKDKLNIYNKCDLVGIVD